jgi:hypothetical protein
VFHSSEVVGSFRHYIPGEPGVISFEENTDADGITALLSPPPLSSPAVIAESRQSDMSFSEFSRAYRIRDQLLHPVLDLDRLARGWYRGCSFHPAKVTRRFRRIEKQREWGSARDRERERRISRY